MSSESSTPPPAPDAPKPAFKIGAQPSEGSTPAAAPRPAPAAGVTRSPVPPRPAASAGTAAPARVVVPVEADKGVSPALVVLDLLAAAAAVTFAVLLYQIYAGPKFPL